ncbi:FG-GAP-like repeat-containing protein [Anaeromyxobacter terrae]|uniref:FG-GAP-like repeat-containing protein n=1 Tax=Anaeromyxobacter terrae TaxID=2925406 RepID=UPI001F59C126|nr:FG-GAP-like repeat-containing protein [Anaeromyxobacter sp. SG22]
MLRIRSRALAALASLSAAAVPVAARGAWSYDLAKTVVPLPVNYAPAPVAADWNGDGVQDLVVGLYQPSLFGGVAVYLRDASGALGPATSAFASGSAASVLPASYHYRPAVADWNGDGLPDLLLGQRSGSPAAGGVLFCPNTGAVGAPVIHGVNCRRLTTAAGAVVGVTTGSSFGYLSPEVVDWDGDGDLDLLVGTGGPANEKGVRLYRNVGTAQAPSLAEPIFVVQRGVTGGLATETYFAPAVADLDGDGGRDLLVAGAQQAPGVQAFWLWECRDAGTPGAPLFPSCTSSLAHGLVHNAIDAVDWDGDGTVDLLRGFFSGLIGNPVTLLHGSAPDTDGDGLSDPVDNCPATPNPADMKLDRSNPVQIDTDGDGAGDACDDDDDDGDGVTDASDHCPLTPDAAQGDVDGDGRGDACDPHDDRPGAPGVGSYEWRQAHETLWGRRPVIVLRADALSIGFRSEIAFALAREATSRGIAFSLAVIPWNAARLAGSTSAPFLSEMARHPRFETVQHGTYHACMYTPVLTGAEFDCGMDFARSLNLMFVGKDALETAVDRSGATHALAGFIPPEDQYDDAALDAIAALGYRYIGSSYSAEKSSLWLAYVDARGLVHIPWSQTACGNGASPWIECRTTSLEAHAGVDCADEAVCKPTKDAKSYEPWSDFALNTLAARCRYDIESRYGGGLCSILFELSSYDDGTSTGGLDPVAFEGYQRVLDDLQALATEKDAVFMTLGEYAAARSIEDFVKPEIAIVAPAARAYGHAELVTVGFEATDALSGVFAVSATLDGRPVANREVLDLLALPLGRHVLRVMAEDTARNVAERQVAFEVRSTLASLEAAVVRLRADGRIDSDGVATSLLAKLASARSALDAGRPTVARNILAAFTNEVAAQRGKHIVATAADLLVADAAVTEAEMRVEPRARD